MEPTAELFYKYRLPISVGVLAFLLLWETVHPFFPFFRGGLKERAKHIGMNVALSALNSLMIALGFSFAWAFAAEWSLDHSFGLLHRLSLSTAIHALLAILLLDFWTYWWHWINHRILFFWRFHRMHHSDNKMDVTTANRFHLGEIFFSSVIRIGLIAILGIKLWELALYEIMLFAVVQFHHANIALPSQIDSFLRVFIPTPAMHKVHHSRIMVETDSNFSSLLSVWDRAFGTFRLRPDLEKIDFGLDGLDSPGDQSFTGLLKLPGKPLDVKKWPGPKKSA
ncbi:MAG: sterol desaturase family protein [Verrucomicrobiales bacterium]